MKKIIGIIMIALLLLGTAACAGEKEITGDDVNMIFFDTGKSDCILIMSEEGSVLIDTAQEDDGEAIVTYLKKLGLTDIDTLIITHFDKDHIGGAEYILENMTVGKVILPDYYPSSSTFKKFYKALMESGCSYLLLNAKEVDESLPVYSFSLGDIALYIYASSADYTGEDDDDNLLSLVIKVTYSDVTALLCGDAPAERIQAILEKTDTSLDILKVSHHGDYSKKYKAAYETNLPTYAVITTGDGSDAEDKLLEMFKEDGVTYYITDNGNVVIHLAADSTITVKQ